MLRVAAYARVSTDKEDQLNSLQNQTTYFEQYIKSNPSWMFAGIFYDKGTSGTQTKRRVGFNRMIDACRAGKIDLILTKEVSRFARNTVDTLEYTRKLREYGVGVYFINDSIDTRHNDGEFRLSIMASVAQEESRKISERVRWGQKIAMENGVVFGNNSLYGYALQDGRLIIRESEAEVVRRIFRKYVYEGKGTYIISRELHEEGIPPPKSDKDFWSSAMLLRILKNEKYVGDLLQKKYVTKSYLTHKKELNNGAENKIYIKNHHEPVIDRATWQRAQDEIKRRRTSGADKSKYSNRYWCSGKIICSRCGSRFVIRRRGAYAAWECRERAQHGKCDSQGRLTGCDMRMINNKSLMACMRCAAEQSGVNLEAMAEETARMVSEIIKTPPDRTLNENDIREKIKIAENKKLNMLDSFFAEQITESEMLKIKAKYDDEIEKLKKSVEILKTTEESFVPDISEAKLFGIIMSAALFSEEVYGEILNKLVVYDDYIIISLKYCDHSLKISYCVHGSGDSYTTDIESVEKIPSDDTELK